MLTELDKRIIQAFELNSQLDFQELASSIDSTLEEVNDRIQVLRTKEIIGARNAVIDTTKLGFAGYGVFLKLKDSKVATRLELVSFLKDNPFVYWISTTREVYDVIFAVQARDNTELNEILSFIVGKFSDVIERYDLATRVQFNHFHRKYLFSHQTDEGDVLWGKDRPISISLSENERYVLNVLSTRGDWDPAQISQETHITLDGVQTIIEGLQTKKIVTGYHTVVHPEKYQYQTYQILITNYTNDKQFSNSLLQFCAVHPNITVLVQSIGLWNYEVTAEVDGEIALQTLLADIKNSFPSINRIQVVPTEHYYEKYCLGFPPIKESGNEVVLKDIQDDDFIILKELVRRTHQPPFDFEYCEGYLLQALRNSPTVAYVNGNMAFVTKKLPELGGNYVIVLADGFDQIGTFTKVCRHLHAQSSKPVIIKNVGEGLEMKLREQRYFREYTDTESWDTYAKYDDNTHPQIIIHNKVFLDLEGPEYQKLREKLNWFDRRYNLEVISYSSEHYGVFDQLLEIWAEQMHSIHGMEKRELINSHLMYRELKEYCFQYLLRDKKTGQWVGYLCASTCSELVCGFNALINDFSIPELYKKMMHKMIEISTRLGFAYTNLQGSESLEQYQTKEWFVPHTLIHKKHLVYDETSMN